MSLKRLVVRKRFGDEWVDVRDFIRPNDFMVEQVLQGRPGWTVEELWQWVIDNIKYPAGDTFILDHHTLLAYHPAGGPIGMLIPSRFYSTVDFWSYPSETLRNRVGDCEDSSFLLTSMIRRQFPDLPAYSTVGLFEDYGHVWTAIKSADGWRVLDTTLGRLPQIVPIESLTGKYSPLFRFNEKEVLIEAREIIVPERVHTPGKDHRVRSWYLLIEGARIGAAKDGSTPSW